MRPLSSVAGFQLKTSLPAAFLPWKLVGVVGAVRSVAEIVHVNDAALPSVLPVVSVAFTLKVWLPTARPVRDAGLVHAEKPPPLSSHSNVESFSVESKLKSALLELLGSDGLPVIDVSGAVMSTVHVKL